MKSAVSSVAHRGDFLITLDHRLLRSVSWLWYNVN